MMSRVAAFGDVGLGSSTNIALTEAPSRRHLISPLTSRVSKESSLPIALVNRRVSHNQAILQKTLNQFDRR